jgi:hypothetical protein
VIEQVMSRCAANEATDIETILADDTRAREVAGSIMSQPIGKAQGLAQ